MRFDGGWIKTHRAITNHWIGKNGHALAIFSTLLCWANYKQSKIMFKGKLITLERGQLLITKRQMADQLGFDRKLIERNLKLLQDDDTIVQQTSNHGTIITIINYDTYQDINSDLVQQMTDKCPTTGPHLSNDGATTGPIVKNIKQLKKERRKELHTPPDGDGEFAKAFIAHYCECYKAKFNSNPVINGKSAGIAKRLVKDLGIGKAKTLIEKYLQMHDQWFITRHYDLTTFEANLNKIETFSETGKRITLQQARQEDIRQNNEIAFKKFGEELEKRYGGGGQS